MSRNNALPSLNILGSCQLPPSENKYTKTALSSVWFSSSVELTPSDWEDPSPDCRTMSVSWVWDHSYGF